MPPAGFEPTISAGEQPQTYVLDRAATGIDILCTTMFKIQQKYRFTYKRNIEMYSLNHCFRGKATSISYSECVSVALNIQHSNSMHRVAICGLSGSITFSTLSHKWHDFRGKIY